MKAFMVALGLVISGFFIVEGGMAVSISNNENPPIIIAHRGASGLLPEHTIEGYQKAIEQGADFIEPDLVITKDGVLIARHDIYLSTTTNVAEHPEFADKKRFIPQLGRRDWLSMDFTLAEIKTLRAVQPREGRDKSHDGKYSIPTLAEIIALAKTHNQANGTNVGIYPETKQPSIFATAGFDFAKILLETLKEASAANGELPVYIQSFDVDILVEIAPFTDIPLIYLLENEDQDDLIVEMAEYKDILSGIGPDKRLLINDDFSASALLLAAKQMGLKVHPWTFRDDDVGDGFDSAEAEYLTYFELGVDGIFTDFSATGVRLKQEFLNSKGAE